MHGGAHQERWCSFVAAHQQYHAVKRMGANGLLNIHGGQISVQHRRWAHQGLAQRDHRELERKPASLKDSPADMIGDGLEVRVAGGELRPGVADADHRPAVELVLRNAAVLELRAIIKAAFILA